MSRIRTGRVVGDKRGKQPRSLTIAANVTHMASVLQRPLARAQQMFDVGAYTHWYRRHGCEDSDIEAAIEAVRCIADAYRDADEEAAAV